MCFGESRPETARFPCRWKLLFEDATCLPERMQGKEAMPVWLLKYYQREYGYSFAEGAHFRVAGAYPCFVPLHPHLYESELSKGSGGLMITVVERVEAGGETVEELLDKFKPYQLIG